MPEAFVPKGHWKQAADPFRFVYVPGPHELHELDPLFGENVPAPHASPWSPPAALA